MVKFVVVLAIFLSAECAAGRYEIKKSRGSCLNYGHACWGAHGKRSDRSEPLSRLDNEATSNKEDAKVEWFLSKMISPLDLRYYRRANLLDASRNQPEIDELFSDPDGGDNIKSANEWARFRELMRNNQLSAAAGSIEDGDKRSTNE
ncbi:uncharacterized protein LOC109533481 isoform X2 [Dendroctonus ponderosae]|uniref:uncharacterized protein LOC109533481 isoform X2 n=1 Tax=Dendroctonus ponderosae TaxID=77166 RepID=UPI00203606B4|nr:uncharacterized protein LOC109533481 isoform X2 [Dendroctonus ponderosae]